MSAEAWGSGEAFDIWLGSRKRRAHSHPLPTLFSTPPPLGESRRQAAGRGR